MLAMLLIGILIGVSGTLAVVYFLKLREKPQDLPEDFFDYLDFDEELFNELEVLFDDKEEEKNGNETD